MANHQPREYLRELSQAGSGSIAPARQPSGPAGGGNDYMALSQQFLQYQMKAQEMVGEIQLELAIRGQELNALAQEHERATAQITSLNEERAGLMNKVTTMSSEHITAIGAVQTEVAAKTTALTSKEAEVTALTTKLSELQTAFDALQAEFDTLKAAKEELERISAAAGQSALGLPTATPPAGTAVAGATTPATAGAPAALAAGVAAGASGTPTPAPVAGASSERGTPLAGVTTLTAEQAALVATPGTPERQLHLQSLALTYVSRKKRAEQLGGHEMREFLKWRETTPDIQEAISLVQ